MKKIAIIIMMFCVGVVFAQEQNGKVKLEKKGDLVQATYFDTNGVIDQQGFFKNDKRHGSWISFNEKGERIVEGYYNEGMKSGKWIFRTEETLKEVDYLNNKIISVNEWSDKSSILVTN